MEDAAVADLRFTEDLQRAHYDAIADAYQLHYADRCSRQYMREFFFTPMVEGIPLRGMRVLDAMCGSGPTVGFLLEAGATVIGLDISSRVIEDFRAKWPECEAVEASIFGSSIEDASFDCVVIIGGLHHLHPHLDAAMDELHRILKPGGYLCFAEPHVGSLPDFVRRLWYRVDPLFGSNEMGVDVDHLEAANAGRFELIRRRYMGGVAYLFVLNSLAFRVPLRLKPVYSRLACRLEALSNRFAGKRTSCYVMGQWRKLSSAPGAPAENG